MHLILSIQYSADVLAFVFNLMCIVCSMIWPSYYCYFATIATEEILAVGDYTYNSKWYNYPVKLQKHVILIVARSHKRVHFSGLNLMYCTLEYFGKVKMSLKIDIKNMHFETYISLYYSFQILKTSCSYYVIFRSVSAH